MVSNMWLDNLKELKKGSNMTLEQIAEKSKVPESTVKRVFSGKNEPSASTLFRIVDAMGGSLDDILSDTSAVIAPAELVEIKEVAEVVEAERDVALIQNEMLETKIKALEMEIALLKKDLQHKDELLAVHNYYISLSKTNVKME
jgi:transcriptional regulator with XRE-family HTH domain